jgi:hypothetical protein
MRIRKRSAELNVREHFMQRAGPGWEANGLMCSGKSS